MKWFFYNLLSIVLALLAAYLLLCDKAGWYWFLIVAALAGVKPSGRDE